MSFLTSEQIADRVADTLRTLVDSSQSVGRNRYPNYELSELDELKIDVVARWPVGADAHDRISTAADQSVGIFFQARVYPNYPERIDELTMLVEKLAHQLALIDIPVVGALIEPVEVFRADEQLESGRFAMFIGCAYRVFREGVV